MLILFRMVVLNHSSLRFQGVASFTTLRKFHPQQHFNQQSPKQQKQQVRYLNRFLFDPEEVELSEEKYHYVTLSKEDYRTQHAAKILGLLNGDTIRAGVVGCPGQQTDNNDDNGSSPSIFQNNDGGGMVTDNAIVEWIPEGKVKKKEPLGNGKPPGSLKVVLHDLSPSPPSNVPTVALLLALPRPLQLGRMLPMIAQMGVSHLILSQAKKVPKDYFGSHIFREPQVLRERLIEGLGQAGDVNLPQVHIVKNLKHFLQDDLDTMFPLDEYARVVTHPKRNHDDNPVLRMRNVQFPTNSNANATRILLAVGPEGGWEEPEELERFQEYEFQQITMGNRVLRSDCAVVSLLALAHDACSVD